MSSKGLAIFFVFMGLGAYCLQGQILKEISGAVKTATEPAKDAQKVLKEASQPAKDANKAIQTVEKAPQTVEKEYGKVGTQAERTQKDYEKTADKLGLGGDKKDDKAKDSTAAKSADAGATDAKGGASTAQPAETVEHKSTVPPDYVPETKTAPVVVAPKKAVDPMDVPRPVPPGSRDNKTPSGPLPPSEVTKAVVTGGSDATTTATDTRVPNGDNKADAADGRMESRSTNPADASTSNSVTDPATVNSNTAANTDLANSASSSDAAPTRYVDLNSTPRSGERRPKPDYSHSPARIALEKADFDIETLEDLFKFSNWEGPEREHTVRAVAQALDELQQAIVEIKKLDPGQSTWRFEEAYKDTKAAYIAEMKRQQ